MDPGDRAQVSQSQSSKVFSKPLCLPPSDGMPWDLVDRGLLTLPLIHYITLAMLLPPLSALVSPLVKCRQ